MSSNEASIIAVIGATGSGKSLYIKTQLLKKSDRRLIVWDYMREYGPLVEQSTGNLADVVRALKGKTFRLAFQPSFDAATRAKQFDLICKAAYAAGHCVFLVEELAFVTKPSHAPAGWQMVSCTGRHKGMRIIGASQRPAQIDKDFFSNCTEIHTGFLNYENDKKVMAGVLGVQVSDIEALEPLQYIHKHVRTKKIVTGKLKPPPRA
jgi:hypothetical protein